ncbi:PREDICTED: protocadherin alpha-C2-like isoform X1 [Crocodylus porosus]|uniref:protocadherin alpha-C2-like isoform X1 n=1 Tax=Crocodylus porosus TaxID=8502 RepID=UPI0009405401|nr:PREDICTED: protocadherin alpha-C2-like isoform X1 [Crocodylus porosus]
MAPASPRTSSGAAALGIRALLLLLCLGPACGQLRYSVQEELPLGAFVGNVARDLGVDPRRLAARGARLTSGSGRQYLELELGRGALLVKERMDREALCELSLTCFLSLELVIEQPIEVHNVEVEVVDINDNAPSFPRQDYRLEISESAVPGARFHIESAHDPDVGTNTVQTYRLSPSQHFALDLKGFQRGSKLLELVLQQPLDREQSALQQLVLTAVDGGSPARSGTAQISIRVLDTNDNSPVFDRSTYTVSLLENAALGTLVVRLNASDPDEGSNGEVLYSFSSYTPQKVRQLFSVDPHSGEVRVNGTLDYEEASSYEIYVQATDRGPVSMVGHCKVLVNIVDANDNAPEVVLTSLYSPVPEDARAETVVALMSVMDQDSGLNKQVSLSIPPDIPFKLNSFKNSYTLVTQGKLDRETASSYNITVTATDSGSPPLSSRKVIQVDISDINDNPPQFEGPAYSVYIPENNPLGVSLCTVKATDPDANENAYVSYSLLNGDIQGLPVTSYVSIKADNGNIYAVNSFDYEKLREFQIVVRAQDAGSPPLSSTVTVYVYVVDQNDHAPQILYPTSTNTTAAMEMIPRSASAGYLVTKVIAIDADSGQNAWLFYYLAQASDPGLFRVELHSGEIRTTRKLGDESFTTFNLTVVVRDNGEPSLSSSVAITIAVVDRVSRIIPDTRRYIKSTRNYSEITVYLIIALSSVSFIFLLTIIVLTVIKCYRYNVYGDSCCGGFCGVRERCPAEMYKQANNNIDTRIPHGLKVQPHFIEVRGNGSLTKTYCYKACLTAGSGSDTFMFYNTCGPTGTGPPAVVAERHLTGQSGQSAQNLILFKNESITPNEPKQPNPDWRYSASLRAGMQSAVHMEEAGVLRGGPGGPEQQWPTVSSATPEPEAGEVSPPVGAGVNSNSWTFKFGPGNPKQGGPGELPDKFIIPGSPAIISIRQEPQNSQIDKSDFITFGKKEETKKKKKKKKGNKTQEKKEKGNSTTDNSDQ